MAAEYSSLVIDSRMGASRICSLIKRSAGLQPYSREAQQRSTATLANRVTHERAGSAV